MKRFVKVIIIVAAISLVLMVSVGGIIFFSLKDYHDRNSWATFEINGNGIAKGEYKYKCTPDVNVCEVQDRKGYGKGETIQLDYASFTINRVDIGSKEGVSISSDEDLLYNGEHLHKVYLKKGKECEIRVKGKDGATIKLLEIWYQ